MSIHEINKGAGPRPSELVSSRPADSKGKEQRPVGSVPSDQVEISDKSRELMRIRSLVGQASENRAKQIDQLTTDIDQGNYHVGADLIAAAIIRKHQIHRDA